MVVSNSATSHLRACHVVLLRCSPPSFLHPQLSNKKLLTMRSRERWLSTCPPATQLLTILKTSTYLTTVSFIFLCVCVCVYARDLQVGEKDDTV